MKNWPVLISFSYPLEAHLAKGYLEANGIETILKDEHTVQVANVYSSAIGGVKLVVRDSEYNRGIQLLKDGGYLADEDCDMKGRVEMVLANKVTKKEICPYFGSENIMTNFKPGVFSSVVCAMINLFFLIGAIFPLFKSSLKCFDCGKVWKLSKEVNSFKFNHK